MMCGKMVIAMLALLFNDRTGNNASTVQKTEAKESDNDFLGLSWDSSWTTEQTCPFFMGDKNWI